MKNNILILIIFLILSSKSIAESFKFDTSNIEIKDNGNLILAEKGKATSLDNDLEIEANKFEYLKELDLLKAYGNGLAFILSQNLKIQFDEMIIDQKSSLITATGNIQIFETKKNLSIQTNKINFNRKDNSISSNISSTLIDKNKNVFNVDSFFYETNKNILRIENAKFTDIEGNNFDTTLAYINTKTNKLFGKDVSINLNNKSFNKDNEPRLKGVSLINDEENTDITKGVFTTCKRRNGKCPPWQLSAEKINHDKKKKIINYKNAWLKVYDFPIIYFPKFFHPDPTVKRKSGFLIPTIKNSPNSSNYLNVPYFLALAENKDFTFSPRFYSDDKFLLQTEYRQKNLNSSQISDFSFFKEKNNSTKSHLFYEFDKELYTKNFNESNLNLKIQQSSNDTYLKANRLKSTLIKDKDTLENSLNLNLYSNNLSIDSELIVYEDLSKNKTDRFEYILPKVNLVKKIDNKTKLLGDFSFKSQNLIRNYNTNILEKSNINDLVFNSIPKITEKGFYNNYDFIIKNTNTDAKNSKDYKENENYYLSGLFQYNSSLPSIKESKKYKKIVKPKISLKIAPQSTKDIQDKDSRIDINNVFSLNRVSENDIIEGGISLTYGNEYTVFKKENSYELFSLKFANNLRLKENDDLPKINQIGQKTSNFFSEVSYTPNDYFTTKYSNSLKNNFSDINYENLISEIRVNNFVTTFDYLNENNTKSKNSYLTNTAKYIVNNSNSLIFSTRENKKTNLTEYYNFIYQYKNDCLSASIEYNKDYYSDRDIKPEESVFLKLTIIPFGQTSSPNLKN